MSKPIAFKIDAFSSLREHEEELMKWFARATITEKKLVMEKHGILFTGNKTNVNMSDEDRKEFYKQKKENIAEFSFSILLYAIFICKENSIKKLCNDKDEANQILAEIEEERTIKFLNKNRKTRFKDKLRKHYFKIKELREKHNASWNEITRLLKRNNAQYYQKYKITSSYLRRTFNEIQKEEEELHNEMMSPCELDMLDINDININFNPYD